MAMLSVSSQTIGLCLLVESARGGSVTNGFSFDECDSKTLQTMSTLQKMEMRKFEVHGSSASHQLI